MKKLSKMFFAFGFAGLFCVLICSNRLSAEVTGKGLKGALRGVTGGLAAANSGIIADSYSTARVIGERFVGGLVGESSGNITNSYAAGKIFGEQQTGGVVGKKFGYSSIFVPMEKKEKALKSSYYDSQTIDQDDDSPAIPKTTEEMMQQETFKDWDFEEVWTINEGQSYPYLRWEDNNLPPGQEKETDNTVAKSPVRDGLQLKIRMEPEDTEFEESQTGGLIVDDAVTYTYPPGMSSEDFTEGDGRTLNIP